MRSDFGDFFAAVRPGQRPFAWQERLLDLLLSDGRWPDRIVAPTSAGKTAVVDVHVFANALAAAGRGPRIPRRLVLVVDRRSVVDSHHDHARQMAAQLADAREGLLRDVADALASFRLELPVTVGVPLDAAPLVTARLRGGAPPPRGWRDLPEMCSVLTGTPDMIGSRLLLQGYGSSWRAWPREAGLLAFDTALVVDEAHLSRQFMATARRVAELVSQPESPMTDRVPVLQVVETTATPQPGIGREIGVEDADLADAVLDRRLRTPKPIKLLPLGDWPLPSSSPALELLVDEVRQARADFGPTVGCVVNRVATATTIARLLRSAGLTVELLVGRMRPADLDYLRRRRPGLLSAHGNTDVDVLVATQTVEVGLDLDLSALVTELAPGAALAQRSGRVNRRGNRSATRVVVAVPASGKIREGGTEPYTPGDLSDAFSWLGRLAENPEGLAPWSLRADPPPGQRLPRLLLRRLELADAWTWARTSVEPFARPDLDLWLADDLAADRDAGLVCRAGMPSDPALALDLLRLLPPRAHEVFPVGIGTLRSLLSDLHAAPGLLLRKRGDEVAILRESDDDLRAGDILVVDADAPVHVEGVVVAGESREPAADVLEHVPATADGRLEPVRPGAVVLRWGSFGSSNSSDRTATGTPPEAAPGIGHLPRPARTVLQEGPAGTAGRWSRDQRRALADILASTSPDHRQPPEQRAVSVAMRNAAVTLLRRGRVQDAALRVFSDDDEPTLLVLTDLRRTTVDEDVRQTWTPNDDPVPLDQHAEAVAKAAAQLAHGLGLDEESIGVLRLAGHHHDDGKADRRFQAVLGRCDNGPLLAKSATRGLSSDATAQSAAGLPPGWRHEQRSVLNAWREVPEPARRLVARLVGTTHGHGRGGFPHGAATLLDESDHRQLAADAQRLFDDGEWEHLVEDTDEQLGVWTMAYLEALLRAADGRVSAVGS
ncbi:type I-U CRISPR-associated helicase/endonuclease Cas3 [Geodermatophilus sp. SYSU D00867]